MPKRASTSRSTVTPPSRRPCGRAPPRGCATRSLFSSVAVAATGVAVSGGVLAGPRDDRRRRARRLDGGVRRRRPRRAAAHERRSWPSAAPACVSRSADRRAGHRPGQGRRAARERRPGRRPDREADADATPATSPGRCCRLRLLRQPVLLPRPALRRRERLARRRRQPDVRGVRHPAGAARREDGLRRRRLGDQPGDPDQWGLGYIRDRYGTPCGAWTTSSSATAGTEPTPAERCGPGRAQGWVIDSTSRAASSSSSVISPRST